MNTCARELILLMIYIKQAYERDVSIFIKQIYLYPPIWQECISPVQESVG